MFKLINFLLCCVVFVGIAWGCYFHVNEPQPGRLEDQINYTKDAAVFKVDALFHPLSSDPKTAIGQLQPWADTGNSVAQIKLAEMLFKTGNYLQAIQYLKPNVDRNIPPAVNAYGVIVRDGLGGVPEDKLEAYKWFSIAAGRGLKLAEQNALALSHTMSSSEVLQAEQRADAWELSYLSKK